MVELRKLGPTINRIGPLFGKALCGDEPSVEEVVEWLIERDGLKPAGSLARSWRCLNCGDDHGDSAGCDNPDFDSIQFYTVET